MKELIEILPTLTAPIKGEVLFMYIATSKESISAVLLAEKGKRQMPIYFVSRVLQGDKLNYPELEKLILALVLLKPENSRRVAKWAIELGEHKIEFKGINSIKCQILTDFLAKIPSSASEEKDKETKLMLISPEGKKYTYALRFEFKATNNEAEYEALLACLRMAKEMEVKDLSILVNSQLVANQVKGSFKARQLVIKQYLDKAKEMLKIFDTYSMEQVQRNQNKKGQSNLRASSEKYTKKEDSVKAITVPKSSHEETPFSLTYCSKAVIPSEINVETKRVEIFEASKNDEIIRENLDLLEQRREITSIREAIHKQKIERYYNKRVRPLTFKLGEYVLRLNSASKAEYQGKMGPTWEGPYINVEAYGNGAYKLKILDG
ncbi:reverse transcriptase domain-containing protein [Tanacetum coccineum]